MHLPTTNLEQDNGISDSWKGSDRLRNNPLLNQVAEIFQYSHVVVWSGRQGRSGKNFIATYKDGTT
jgi:hypothetical protein